MQRAVITIIGTGRGGGGAGAAAVWLRSIVGENDLLEQ